jgi:RimJ/RimL family protein N-acetyltransferase
MLGRQWWGRGFAAEGARAALSYAFDTLVRDHVISVIYPENRASIRVAERLGEQLERTIEMSGRPALIYGVRRDAWGGS